MSHIARLALCLALTISSVVACAPAPETAPPPDGWIAYPTPPPRACAWERTKGSTRDWSVRLDAGRLVIEPYAPAAPDPTLPTFQIPAEEMRGGICPECVMRVDDGYLVGFNYGEFGGRLWATDAAGGSAYPVPHTGRCNDVADTGRPTEFDRWSRGENVQALVRSGDRIFVLTGLAHFFDQGEFSRVDRRQGKWQTCLAHNLESMPITHVADDTESWFVMTLDGLVRVDVRGAMRKFGSFSFLQEYLYPGSMVKLADGTLYVGLSHFVARLTPTTSGVYREELFVPKERPEFDYVPSIDGPTARHQCKGKKPSDRQ